VSIKVIRGRHNARGTFHQPAILEETFWEVHMQIGDLFTFDRYQWRVLALRADTALIMTEDIIAQRPFHTDAGAITWQSSAIRHHLNHDFYQQFTPSNQSRIVPTLNQNLDNPWYQSTGGPTTKDNIFLLSLEEAVCQYFGDSRANLEQRSPKQRYWFQKKDPNNERRQASLDQSSWWWLRTPGRDNRRMTYVWGNGNIGIQGNRTYHYSSKTVHPSSNDNSGGIRPALWLQR